MRRRSRARLRLPAIAPAALAAAAALAVAPAPPAAAADMPIARAVHADGHSGRFLLGGTWYTRPDPTDRGARSRWERATSLAGWATVSVPHAANAGDFSPRSYLGGVQWYRKEFRAPAGPPRARWILRFESVNYRATVWLNGRRLGRHEGAYLPFELRADDLRRTGVNRLVVRVDSRRNQFDVPALAVRRDGRYIGGWWNYTGILREVYLRRVEALDFQTVLVRPDIRCRECDAQVRVETIVRNLGRRPSSATVEAHVDGRSYDIGPQLVPPGRARRLARNVRIDDPKLWNPGDPQLYPVRLVLRDEDGDGVLRYSLHTGIRKIEVSDSGRLLVNFQPVTLRGANLHEDDLTRGAALRPARIREDIDLLRELGATMTRAHYPLHPLLLELADRHGIMVWSEVPVYQMQDQLFRRRAVRRQSLRMVREMVLRDRNHPSVLVWSVGNENTARPGTGFRRYVRQALRATKRIDPTRLVGVAIPGYPTVERQPLYASLDALGINDYFGWYPGPESSISDRAGLAPYLDRLHDDYPRQALFVTEFGAEANRSGAVTEKGTFEFQRDFLAYHLSVFASRPFVNSALVWILRDFRVKPGYEGGNPKPEPPKNHKGLIDDTGARKPGFEVVREALQAQRAR